MKYLGDRGIGQNIMITIVVVIIVVVGAGAYLTMRGGGGPGPGPTKEKITVGVTMPLSGGLAHEGEITLDGIELGVQKVNEMGGVPIGDKKMKIELKYYDSESKPEKSKELARKLVEQDKVDWIAGQYGSNLMQAVMPYYERNKIPVIAHSTLSPAIYEQGYEWIHCTTNLGPSYLLSVLKYFANMPEDERPQKFGMVTVKASYTKSTRQGALDWFNEHGDEYGMELVVDELIAQGATDVSTTLQKMDGEGVEVLLSATYISEGVLVMRQCKSLDINFAAYCFILGPTATTWLEELGAERARYTISTGSHFFPKIAAEGPLFGSAQDFYDYAEQNLDYKPDYHTALGASPIATFYVTAVTGGLGYSSWEDQQTFREEMLSNLNNIDTEIFWGTCTFNEQGYNPRTLVAIQRQGEGADQMEVVAPEQFKSVDMVFPAPTWDER